jgi:hypothetical protein
VVGVIFSRVDRDFELKCEGAGVDIIEWALRK